MASISGASSSNMTSSLYNSANIISGLASGLDTEGMIESLVQSYQTKINSLNQKVTKTEWKQDAYRSIIQKMYNFSGKYTSYSSNTNLLSPSFFSSAVKVFSQGKYADAVTASGKSTSDVALNAVHQLATAAQFRTNGNMAAGDGKSIMASSPMDMNGSTTLASLNGSLTLTYGSKEISVQFDQVADVKAMEEIRAKRSAAGQSTSNADVLADLINQKLEKQKISLTGGASYNANDRILVSAQNGTISFSDKSNAGNAVFISNATGNVGTVLGIKDALNQAEEDKDKPTQFAVGDLTKQVKNGDYLSGQVMTMSLDGNSKSINLPNVVKDATGVFKIVDSSGQRIDYNADNYIKVLSESVDQVFKGKVKVSNALGEGADDLQLRFEVQEGSNLLINTDGGETLGIGRTATSYLNTSKTLGELLGEDQLSQLSPARDRNGALILDSKGNQMYTFAINGVAVGNYSKESKLADLMNDINSSAAGVKVSYSRTTKNFLFTAKETGEDGKIEMGGGLASMMFGGKIDTDELNSQKLSDFLSDDGYQLKDTGVKGEKFSLTVNGTKYTYTFGGSNPTIQQVLDALNSAKDSSGKTLSQAGMKVEVKYNGELVVRDKTTDRRVGDAVFDKNSLAEKFANELQSYVQDYSPINQNILNETKVNTLGVSTKGKTIEFEADGKKFSYTFQGDPTLQQLLGGLSAAKDENGNTLGASGMQAHFNSDGELVISKNGTGEKVEIKYNEDSLADKIVTGMREFAKNQKETDFEQWKTQGIKEILDNKPLEAGKKFSLTLDGEEYSYTFSEDDMKDEDLTLSKLVDKINDAVGENGRTLANSGMTASLNERGQLVITKKGSGEAVKVDDCNSLAQKIMSGVSAYVNDSDNQIGYTKGQDAIFNVTVNGETMQMRRSSNSIDIDGMTINMQETFNTKTDENGDAVKDDNGRFEVENMKDAVTFKSVTDSDKIVDAIKSMIADYNIMMLEVKSAFSTMPYQKSNGKFANYEPLTEDERSGMTESAIERYEEKAKQGILFGDRTLSTMYEKLRTVFAPAGEDGAYLRAMGITTSYSITEGTQAVTLDEDKLRAMLDSDPELVADVFTKSSGNGGVMQNLKTQLDNYSKTTGEPKGLLIQQAGSPLSSLSLMGNTWQKEIDRINTQIEKWQDKLADQVDRYTQQFSRLEQLVNQMNSQSSALAGLMGG